MARRALAQPFPKHWHDFPCPLLWSRTQAYLDLIELLGNASLKRQSLTRITPAAATVCLAITHEATVPQVANASKQPPTPTAIGDPTNVGNDQEKDDAGGVLLSILAGHCITQATLFKRLIRAAIRFDGVGASHRRSCLHASRTAATTSAVLDAHNNDFLLAGAGGEGGGIAEVNSRSGNGIDAAGGERACHSASGGKGIRLSREFPLQNTPSRLERCSRLLVHCVRWIRGRHGNSCGRSKLLIEEDASESSEESDCGARDSGGGGDHNSRYGKRGRGVDLDEGKGGEFGDVEQYSGLSGGGGRGRQGRCSSRAEDVRFATSRECYMAMRMAFLEFETALSMTGGLVAGDAYDADGSNRIDGDLADTIATVASGLLELFIPMVTTTTAAATTTTTTTVQSTEKGKEVVGALAPVSAPTPDRDPASITATTKKRGDIRQDGGTEGIGGKPLPFAAIDVFPEHMKLLLMRVLERVYLVGKAAAMTAVAALAKPSSAFIATVVASPRTSSLSPSPPPPPPLAPPSPPLAKRHRQQRAAEAAGKPGDRAGGVPTKSAERGTTASAGRSELGGRGTKAAGGGRASAAGASATVAVGAGCRPSRSKLASQSSSPSKLRCKIEREGQLQEGDCLDGGAVDACAVRFIRTAGSGSAVSAGSQEGVAVLLVVLPVVAFASGDCLQVMAAARRWTEGLRAKSRKAGDDPCRKRVSFGPRERYTSFFGRQGQFDVRARLWSKTTRLALWGGYVC